MDFGQNCFLAQERMSEKPRDEEDNEDNEDKEEKGEDEVKADTEPREELQALWG